MDTKLYLALSFAMFMEFAVWAAWMPVLATRLLGPLKMTGKQTGWIYAALPLACIVSPLIAGVLADKYFHTEYILGVAHLVGAVLLFLVANKTTFKSIFWIMLLYCLFYAGTLPLVNAVLFANVSDVGSQGKVFIWAPVAWALIGWFLSGWRWIFKSPAPKHVTFGFSTSLTALAPGSPITRPKTTTLHGPPTGRGSPSLRIAKERAICT